MPKIYVYVPEHYIIAYDKLVRLKVIPNRSEGIRLAMRDDLKRYFDEQCINLEVDKVVTRTRRQH